jgi:hypothetical protein
MYSLTQNEDGHLTVLVYPTKKVAEAKDLRYRRGGVIEQYDAVDNIIFKSTNLSAPLANGANYSVFADDVFVCKLQTRQEAQTLAKALRPYHRTVHVKAAKIMAIS